MDTAASSGFQFQPGASEGFSIPINTALNLAHQIMGNKASSKVHIGASALLGVIVHDGTSPPAPRWSPSSPGPRPSRPASPRATR